MNCNICFQAYNCFQRRPLAFACGHSVCEDCAMKLKTICPFCKKQSSLPKHNDALQQFLMKVPYYYITTIYDHTFQIPLDSFLNVPIAIVNVNAGAGANANVDANRDRDGPLTQVINDELNKFLIRNDWGPDDVIFSNDTYSILLHRHDAEFVVSKCLDLGLKIEGILTILLSMTYGANLGVFGDCMSHVLSLEHETILEDFDSNNIHHQHAKSIFIRDVKTGDRIEPYPWDENLTKFLNCQRIKDDNIMLFKLAKYPPRWKVTEYYGGQSIVFIPSATHRLMDEWISTHIRNNHKLQVVNRSDYMITFKLLNPCLTITKEHVVSNISQFRGDTELSVYSYLHSNVCVAVDATVSPPIVSQVSKTELTSGFESTEVIIDILFEKAVIEFHTYSQSDISAGRQKHVVTMFLDMYQFEVKEKIANDFVMILKKYGLVKDNNPIEFIKH